MWPGADIPCVFWLKDKLEIPTWASWQISTVKYINCSVTYQDPTVSTKRVMNTVVHSPPPNNCPGQYCNAIEAQPNPLATPREYRYDFFDQPENANKLRDQILAHYKPPPTNKTSTLTKYSNTNTQSRSQSQPSPFDTLRIGLMNRKGNL
jgi:hypothetical protein